MPHHKQKRKAREIGVRTFCSFTAEKIKMKEHQVKSDYWCKA
jgi:hypothetical protein